jgi:RecA/RadA recombinase
MYAQYLPIINSDLLKSGSTLLYTNQLRQKPAAPKYTNPFYEPCGDTLKFFSSIRLMLNPFKPKLDSEEHPFLTKDMIPSVEVREGGVWEENHITEKGEVVGLDKYVYTGIKTVKNKVYTPYQSCWMRIHFEENGSTGTGLDPVFDIFTFLYETGYIVPLKVAQANGKEKKVAGSYKTMPCSKFDPTKEFDMPETFDYYVFKKWVYSKPTLVMDLRNRLLVSGLVYDQGEEEVILDDIDDEELEEQALAEIQVGLEEVNEPKKKGRKKKEEKEE